MIQPFCWSFFCWRGRPRSRRGISARSGVHLPSFPFIHHLSCLVSLVSRVSSAKLTSPVIGTVAHDAARIADLPRHADNLSPLCVRPLRGATPPRCATSLRASPPETNGRPRNSNNKRRELRQVARTTKYPFCQILQIFSTLWIFLFF